MYENYQLPLIVTFATLDIVLKPNMYVFLLLEILLIICAHMDIMSSGIQMKM